MIRAATANAGDGLSRVPGHQLQGQDQASCRCDVGHRLHDHRRQLQRIGPQVRFQIAHGRSVLASVRRQPPRVFPTDPEQGGRAEDARDERTGLGPQGFQHRGEHACCRHDVERTAKNHRDAAHRDGEFQDENRGETRDRCTDAVVLPGGEKKADPEETQYLHALSLNLGQAWAAAEPAGTRTIRAPQGTSRPKWRSRGHGFALQTTPAGSWPGK